MLTTNPSLTRPDEIYARFIAAHAGLTEAESHTMNVRLIHILMNPVGEHGLLDKTAVLSVGPESTPNWIGWRGRRHAQSPRNHANRAARSAHPARNRPVLRHVLPERVPAAGLLILRDGEPGEIARRLTSVART